MEGGNDGSGEKFLLLPEDSTYYCAAKGCLTDRSLPMEMMHPGSTYEKHIESSSMVWEPVDI